MSLLDTASLVITPNGYKEGKLYSVVPSDGSGDLNVTRTTTATRVNEAGLVELVPYNLLTYSEQLDNGAWTTFNASVTANTTTAPNGTTTADTITSNDSGGGDVYRSITVNGTYTLSAYFKAGTTNLCRLGSTASGLAEFNLSTETYTLLSGVSASITSVGSGWYRCTLTINNTSSTLLFLSSYDVTGKTVYAWGVQFNEGSTSKDYQKTETRLNIPRLDYSNGTCPSILVEPQRTNILTYSEDFTNGWYAYLGSISATANYGIAPDGTTTSTRILFTSNNQIWAKAISGLTGLNGTFSLYIKGVTGQTISISYGGNDNTVTLQSGWNRYSVTGVGTIDFVFINTFSSTATNIEVWGGQIEAGSYATSYIPTTSASVTRNADVISKTGISSLIGQTEGTMFVDFNKTHTYSTDGELLIMNYANANPATNRVQFVFVGNNIELYATDGTNAVYSGTITSISNGRHKLAVTYGLGGYVVYLDGVSVFSNSATWSPTTDSFRVGSYATSVAFYSDTINSTSVWKTRLTNTQLAQLTTI